jgi:hypothetical protein
VPIKNLKSNSETIIFEMSKARKLKKAETWLRLVKSGTIHAKDIGLPGARNDGDGDLSRFIARWRLAANFVSVGIDGYKEDAIKGYTGIIKLVLAVNAGEQFSACLGIQSSHMVHLESVLDLNIHPIKWTATVRRVFEMLDRHLEFNNLKRRISIAIEREHFDLLPFAFGVRHLFSHGIFTAGANDADARSVGSLCIKVADNILDSLEIAFSSSVAKIQNHN